MDKYCTYRIHGRRYCRQAAVAPHPFIANETLCREHKDAVRNLMAAWLTAGQPAKARS